MARRRERDDDSDDMDFGSSSERTADAGSEVLNATQPSIAQSRAESNENNLAARSVSNPRTIEGGDDEARRRYGFNIAMAARQRGRMTASGGNAFNDPTTRANNSRHARTSNYWMITAWNRGNFRPQIGQMPLVSFMAGQQERGEQNGNLHWQVYVEFTMRISATAAMAALGLDPKHTFIQPRLGSVRQAIDYVSKENTAVPGTRFSEGQQRAPTMPEQFNMAMEMVTNGANFAEVLARYPAVAVNYCNGITKAINTIAATTGAQKGNNRDLFVLWLWGPTGTGKTARVMARFTSGIDLYRIPMITQKGNLWFDGLGTQPVLFIDELMGSKQFPLANLLQVLDEYSLQLPVKGTFTQALYNTVIITSNLSPEEAYAEELQHADPKHVAAFRRRLPFEARIYVASMEQDIKTLGLGKCPKFANAKRRCELSDIQQSRAAMALDGKLPPPPLPKMASAHPPVGAPPGIPARSGAGSRATAATAQRRPPVRRAPAAPSPAPLPLPTPSPEPFRPPIVEHYEEPPRLTTQALAEYLDTTEPPLIAEVPAAEPFEEVTTTVQRVDVDCVPIGGEETVKVPVRSLATMSVASSRFSGKRNRAYLARV